MASGAVRPAMGSATAPVTTRHAQLIATAHLQVRAAPQHEQTYPHDAPRTAGQLDADPPARPHQHSLQATADVDLHAHAFAAAPATHRRPAVE